MRLDDANAALPKKSFKQGQKTLLFVFRIKSEEVKRPENLVLIRQAADTLPPPVLTGGGGMPEKVLTSSMVAI